MAACLAFSQLKLKGLDVANEEDKVTDPALLMEVRDLGSFCFVCACFF